MKKRSELSNVMQSTTENMCISICVLSGCLKPNSITLAGSKLVADRLEAKFHYEAGRRPASNLSATSFEPASNQLA